MQKRFFLKKIYQREEFCSSTINGEAIKNHLSLIPLEANPTLVSYLNLSLKNLSESNLKAGSNALSSNDNTTTYYLPPTAEDKEEIAKIFGQIGVRATTKQGILLLHQFKKVHPNIDLTPWFSGCSPELRAYIKKHLDRCAEHDSKSEAEASNMLSETTSTATTTSTVNAESYEMKLRALQSRVGLVPSTNSLSNIVPNPTTTACAATTSCDVPKLPQRPVSLTERLSTMNPSATSMTTTTATTTATSTTSSTEVSIESIKERLARIRASQAETTASS